MKILLTILSILLILFSGGCVVALSGGGTGPLMLLPGAVLAVNLLLIAAIFGWMPPIKPLLYALAVIDILAGISLVLFFVGLANQYGGVDTGALFGLAALLGGGFIVKGILTWRYIRALP